MKPNPNEDEKTFTRRFMNDDAMKAEYPNIDQRMAVCKKAFAAAQLSEFAEVSNVEIFKAGTYYGKVYTEDDLAAIADNTNKLITDGKHRAPSKLGHDDDQTFAKLNGLPSVGWVSRIVKKGASLYADFINVPSVVKEAIDKKLYNSVSSEIYLEEHARREFGVTGMVLRAVAWLGADVPKVKGMLPLSALLHDTEASVAVVAFLTEGGGNPPKSPESSANANVAPADAKPLEIPKEPKISDDPAKPGETGGDKASEKTQQEVKMTEQEIAALKASVAESEKKLAEALKFGEDEKAARLALESKNIEARIVAFMEAHKETLIPALQPSFKALALSQSAVIKLDDKEVAALDAFLTFTEEVLKAKVVTLKEIPEAKDGAPAEADVKKLEEKFQKSSKNAGTVLNADLAIRAEKYAEENKCSFRDALLKLSTKQEDK